MEANIPDCPAGIEITETVKRFLPERVPPLILHRPLLQLPPGTPFTLVPNPFLPEARICARASGGAAAANPSSTTQEIYRTTAGFFTRFHLYHAQYQPTLIHEILLRQEQIKVFFYTKAKKKIAQYERNSN